MRRKAAERKALRELMDRNLTEEQRRHPLAIMLDAVQRLDVITREARFDHPAAYVEHVALVVRMAKLLVDAGVADKLAAAEQAQARIDGTATADLIVAVFDHVLDALPLDPVSREPARVWLLGCAQAQIATREGGGAVDYPPTPALTFHRVVPIVEGPSAEGSAGPVAFSRRRLTLG